MSENWYKSRIDESLRGQVEIKRVGYKELMVKFGSKKVLKGCW